MTTPPLSPPLVMQSSTAPTLATAPLSTAPTMFRANARALTPLTLEQILAQPQPQPLSSDEARTVAQELVLLMMGSVKPGTIDPMKYWERARSALLAGAEAQDVERMVGVMADKLEVEQLPQHVCSSLCLIFDRLRDPVVCARFLSEVRAPGMGAVIVGLARVAKQSRASAPSVADPLTSGHSAEAPPRFPSDNNTHLF